MWDLPGPGIEPLSSALADRFLTTVPPGKSYNIIDHIPYAVCYIAAACIFSNWRYVLLHPFHPFLYLHPKCGFLDSSGRWVDIWVKCYTQRANIYGSMPTWSWREVFLACCKYPHWVWSFFLFLTDFIFKSSFRFTAKLSRKYREFIYSLCPHIYTTSPTSNIWHWSGAFVTINEPTLHIIITSSL